MSESLLTFLQHLREFGLVFQRKVRIWGRSTSQNGGCMHWSFWKWHSNHSNGIYMLSRMVVEGWWCGLMSTDGCVGHPRLWGCFYRYGLIKLDNSRLFRLVRGSPGGTTPPDWPSLWLPESPAAPRPPACTPLLELETPALSWLKPTIVSTPTQVCLIPLQVRV